MDNTLKQSIKRRLLVAVPLLLLVAGLAWYFRPRNDSLGAAYVSDRNVTLWSSLAQVRSPVATLQFGDKVEVLARRNENVQVRTSAGEKGWLDAARLVDPAMWQRSVDLLNRVRNMPVQARGRTKVSTNLRVEPGRTQSRLTQFPRGVAVEIVGREVAEWAPTGDEKDSSGDTPEAKSEDWLLIRGSATHLSADVPAGGSEVGSGSEMSDQPVPVAGWVIGRFIELDLPDEVREGSESAGLRPLAWFELNRVSTPNGEKPQYLVAGVRGPEGQDCDFTTLHVFTWDVKKAQYQTAFIENNLCGRLPIRMEKGPKGEAQFRFSVDDQVERVYRLMQTVIRRVKENEAAGGKKQAAGTKAAANSKKPAH